METNKVILRLFCALLFALIMWGVVSPLLIGIAVSNLGVIIGLTCAIVITPVGLLWILMPFFKDLMK